MKVTGSPMTSKITQGSLEIMMSMKRGIASYLGSLQSSEQKMKVMAGLAPLWKQGESMPSAMSQVH